MLWAFIEGIIKLVDTYKFHTDAPKVTHNNTKNASDTILEINSINNNLLNEVLFLDKNSIQDFTIVITHDLISGITKRIKSYLFDIQNLLDNSPCFDKFDVENSTIFLQLNCAIDNAITYLGFIESLVSSLLDITIESFYLAAFFENLRLVMVDIDKKLGIFTNGINNTLSKGK